MERSWVQFETVTSVDAEKAWPDALRGEWWSVVAPTSRISGIWAQSEGPTDGHRADWTTTVCIEDREIVLPRKWATAHSDFGTSENPNQRAVRMASAAGDGWMHRIAVDEGIVPMYTRLGSIGDGPAAFGDPTICSPSGEDIGLSEVVLLEAAAVPVMSTFSRGFCDELFTVRALIGQGRGWLTLYDGVHRHNSSYGRSLYDLLCELARCSTGDEVMLAKVSHEYYGDKVGIRSMA